MKKTAKQILYAEPGTGKSTFASKAGNAFFISTDGNFPWLGLPEKNHVKVSSWKETKDVIDEIVRGDAKYNEFDTIVVDLLEDTYEWCEEEYCKRTYGD